MTHFVCDEGERGREREFGPWMIPREGPSRPVEWFNSKED